VVTTPRKLPLWAFVVDAPPRVSPIQGSSGLLSTFGASFVALQYGARSFVHVRLYAFGVRVVVRVGNVHGLIGPVVPVLYFGPVALPPWFGGVRYLRTRWYFVVHFFAFLAFAHSYKKEVPKMKIGVRK
jgi:hypothetical protein